MNRLRFAGPFAFVAAVPLLYRLSPSGPYFVPPALLFALLVASVIPDRAATAGKTSIDRLLPTLYVPFHLIILFWALQEATRAAADTNGFLSLAISVGVCGGVFGVLAAHELIHSRVEWHGALGTLMLTGIGYRHFRIAHIYGHHRSAATERDPSTARLGESFYRFFIRTLPAQAAFAWRFEQHRLHSRGLSGVHSRVLHDIVIMMLLYGVLAALAGWKAAAFLALQSFAAVVVLELFNYVAHYGLRRSANEPMAEHHSWNSPGAANLLIFNMGRHGAHHRAPSASYATLRSAKHGPELPCGYAGAILLALIPPLWRKTMHPRLEPVGARPPKSGYGGRAIPAAASS